MPTPEEGPCFSRGAVPSMDKHNKNYITHKFIIFVTLFCFQFVVLILSKIKNKCKINIHDIVSDSLLVATSGVIGYSLCNDIKYSDLKIKYLNFDCSNEKNLNIMMAIVLTLFITIIKIIKLLFNPKCTECIKYD